MRYDPVVKKVKLRTLLDKLITYTMRRTEADKLEPVEATEVRRKHHDFRIMLKKKVGKWLIWITEKERIKYDL